MIIFKALRYKNFLSTGSQFTEIILNKSKKTLIIGENGSGKSTMIDSLCFVLFNKPFRKINKPQLVNSINKKDCLVEVEFSINSTEYKVRRGIKPDLFEIYINDELVDQSSSRDYQTYLEDFILKWNYKSFTQIIILGKADYIPFMKLPPATRREVIENLLDINIFSVMNSILKDRQSELKSTIKTADSDYELSKTKVQMQKKYVDNLIKDDSDKKDDISRSIRQSKDEIVNINEELVKLHAEKFERYIHVERKPALTKEVADYQSDIRDIKSEIKKLEQNIKFFNSDICTTCGQKLDENHKAIHIANDVDKKTELTDVKLQLEHKVSQINYILESMRLIDTQIDDIISQEIRLGSMKDAAEKYIKKLNDDIKKLDSKGDITSEKILLKELAKDALVSKQHKDSLNEQKTYYDICGLLLKDNGIKTKIIQQYLPLINRTVNNYLASFDFFVSFELDETFEEVIKSRHRDKFSYASFSEGEKQRIDLSLMLTWRTIAKMKNSADTNLLICDETLDGSLSASAVENLLQIFSEMTDTNLFVITHTPIHYEEKFDDVINFETVNNYSVIR